MFSDLSIINSYFYFSSCFVVILNLYAKILYMLKDKEKIVEILQKGGVIDYVTDTVWGLGCLPNNEVAVRKIYDIKKREAQKPLILMSNEVYNLLDYVKPIPKVGQKLIKKYFPGALTVVTDKSDKTPDYITSNMPTVGIRVPDNEIFRQICEAIPEHVLATTSANLSHQPSAKTYEQAVENMSGLADIVIPDYGHVAKGLESTVVGVMNDELRIFRHGAINIDLD